MEFGEKLQQLRKQHDLTQEQLAQKLYVSRTAVSKWESGKGYPNLESLKAISGLFSISIDALLSGDELLTLAAKENRDNMGRLYALIYGLLDLMAAACVFLPLYGNHEGSYIRAVNLLAFTDTTKANLIVYWSVLTAMIALGAVQLLALRMEKDAWRSRSAKCSLALGVFAILFFTAAREPYATTFLFLLFIMKVLLWSKQMKSR
ncbi:MAG: helix-turn-helix transcriptional regulator [Clostridia bacterium]|nr:helix-turn-helix transcriptional regulator [Clostridia bacterium]